MKSALLKDEKFYTWLIDNSYEIRDRDVDEEENNATPFDEDSAALTGRILESFVEADSFEKDLGSGSTA